MTSYYYCYHYYYYYMCHVAGLKIATGSPSLQGKSILLVGRARHPCAAHCAQELSTLLFGGSGGCCGTPGRPVRYIRGPRGRAGALPHDAHPHDATQTNTDPNHMQEGELLLLIISNNSSQVGCNPYRVYNTEQSPRDAAILCSNNKYRGVHIVAPNN